MTKLITTLILVLALFIRVWQLDILPPSLYWEEVALGYDAYSILKTGADHHGNSWPILAFESFGDWKPSLYFYSIVPMIATFGLNSWAVRLPSALAGVMLVWGMMKLAKWWALETKLPTYKFANPESFGWLVGIMATISPWLINFSRGGWEVNLATALIVWGAYFGLKAASKNKIIFWPAVGSVILLCFSLYAYHSARVIAPLVGLSLFGWWIYVQKPTNFVKSLSGQPTRWLILGILALVMSLPLALSLGSSATNVRFAQTSIFSRSEPIELSNQLIAGHDGALWARLAYHRYWFWLKEISANYFSHFDLAYLFVSGDENPRHGLGFTGLFYPMELLGLAFGLGALVLSKTKAKYFLGWWLAVAFLPAAISEAAPHALRTLPAAPVMIIATATGWWLIVSWLSNVLGRLNFHQKWRRVMVGGGVSLVLLAYLISFAYFWRTYTLVYPSQAAGHWQYGYKEAILALEQARADYPDLPIYISDHQGRPLMYYWFYTKTEPTQVQAASQTATRDQSELLEFENIQVVRLTSQIETRPSLVLISPEQALELDLAQNNSQKLAEVLSIDSSVIWQLWKLE